MSLPVTLGTLDDNQHAFDVDVADLELCHFGDTVPGGISHRKRGYGAVHGRRIHPAFGLLNLKAPDVLGRHCAGFLIENFSIENAANRRALREARSEMRGGYLQSSASSDYARSCTQLCWSSAGLETIKSMLAAFWPFETATSITIGCNDYAVPVKDGV